MTSLDLTEAYLHVPIRPSHRRFQRFCLGNSHWQFKALPFDLASAPRVFTKLLINPIASLRMNGVHMHPYLDNMLVCSSSRSRAMSDTEAAIQSLKDHGYLINIEKSIFSPSQRIEHLGMIINSLKMALFLTKDWIQKTVGLTGRLVHLYHCSVLTLTQLLGLLVANMDALQWGHLHL